MNEHAPYSGSGEHDGVRPRAGSLSPYLLIVTALVAAFAAALAMYLVMRPGLLAAQAAAEPTPAPAATPSPSPTAQVEPTPSPTPSPSPSADWVTLNATLQSPGEAWRLMEAPAGFRVMAAAILEVEDQGCWPEISVTAYHPDGYAFGTEGYSNCGGGAGYVWAAIGNYWVPIFATQDILACGDLRRAGMPQNTGVLDCINGDETEYY